MGNYPTTNIFQNKKIGRRPSATELRELKQTEISNLSETPKIKLTSVYFMVNGLPGTISNF
jgi:hypothetical protein